MAQEIVFVIDRSGSMKGTEGDTIGGYNSFLDKQRTEEGSAYVTTVLFDHAQELLHDRVELQAVSPITDKGYYVRGSTALLDAVGGTIHKIEAGPQEDGVIFVIITDGRENASKHYTYPQIRAMIQEKQKAGWEFIFLGADLADFTDAEQMGIRAERRTSFSKEKSHIAYDEISSSVSSFRKTKQLPKDWASGIQGKQGQIDNAGLPFSCHDLVAIEASRGKAIIDTGSPFSFGIIPFINIEGDRFPLARNPLIHQIQRYIGTDVTAIVGMDILANYDLSLLYNGAARRFVVSFSHSSPQKTDLVLHTSMGIPVLPIVVNGTTMQFFLDTGSTTTYLRSEHLGEKMPVGKQVDFHPLLGEFMSPTYQVQLELQGHMCTVLAGALPESLACSLPSSIKGVIGTDILKYFHATLKFRSGLCHIEKATN